MELNPSTVAFAALIVLIAMIGFFAHLYRRDQQRRALMNEGRRKQDDKENDRDMRIW